MSSLPERIVKNLGSIAQNVQARVSSHDVKGLIDSSSLLVSNPNYVMDLKLQAEEEAMTRIGEARLKVLNSDEKTFFSFVRDLEATCGSTPFRILVGVRGYAIYEAVVQAVKEVPFTDQTGIHFKPALVGTLSTVDVSFFMKRNSNILTLTESEKTLLAISNAAPHLAMISKEQLARECSDPQTQTAQDIQHGLKVLTAVHAWTQPQAMEASSYANQLLTTFQSLGKNTLGGLIHLHDLGNKEISNLEKLSLQSPVNGGAPQIAFDYTYTKGDSLFIALLGNENGQYNLEETRFDVFSRASEEMASLGLVLGATLTIAANGMERKVEQVIDPKNASLSFKQTQALLRS